MEVAHESTVWEKMARLSPDMLCTFDSLGHFTHVSNACQTILGYTQQELIGRHFVDLLHPEDVPVTEATLPAMMTGMKLTSFENRFLHRDGSEIPLLWSAVWSAEDQAFFSIAQDISPLKQAYETIQRQAANLSTILESMSEAFLTVDREWAITYLNGEAERLAHLDKKLHLGANLFEVFPGQAEEEFHQQYVHALQSGDSVDFTAFLQELGVWLHVKAFPSEQGLSIYLDDVSDQVKTQQELEKLSLVASMTHSSVIITDQEDRIEWVNESFTRLTGYTFAEAAGRSPFDLFRGKETDPGALALFSEKLQQGVPFQQELLAYTKAGEKRWWNVEVTPIKEVSGKVTGRIRIQTDITERVEAQRQLEMLSLVASRTNNSVLIADREWRIEWANEGFTKMFGYGVEEALGRRPSELLHGPKTVKESYQQLEGRLLRGEPITFETQNVRKTGEDLWINVDISPVVGEEGEVLRFVEVQTDITALKNSEQELSSLARDLYRQNRDLQHFTYIVSHNLRQPVANVLGLVSLLESCADKPEQFERALHFLRDSVGKLDAVLRDMNTILSIRESRSHLSWELVALNEVLEQALSSFQEQLGKLGAEVCMDIAEGLPVRANKAYLHSIFYNLLSNAIKYRAEGRALCIRIRCLPDPAGGTVLHFSDNGSGFDAERNRGNLFKLYKRFHREGEGRGMGLYLVKSHVEAMGGSIEVRSQVGVGTDFIICLP